MEKRQRVRSLDLAMARLDMERTPGRWVEIPTKAENSNHVVQRQRRGDIPALPPAEFEAKSMGRVAYARKIP